MNVVKITVLRRATHSDLSRAIRGVDARPCELFTDGQVFIAGLNMPDGFCGWAWNDISRMVVALQAGGSFARGAFQGWMRDDATVVACCTDGLRPVTFKLERVDLASLIDVTGVERPAPAEAYASERWGEFTYAFPDLEPRAPHRVRLHFCEVYHGRKGQRRFAVECGGKRLLDDFDIAAEAGGPHRAIVREFEVAADAGGALALRFLAGAADSPKVSAIEVLPARAGAGVVQAVNAGGGACGAFSADRCFTGGNVTGG